MSGMQEYLAHQKKIIDLEQAIDRRRRRPITRSSGFGGFSGSAQEPAGQPGGALVFNGANTWAESNSDVFSAYNVGTRPATIEMWFRLTAQPSVVGASVGDFKLPPGSTNVGDVLIALPNMRPAFIVMRDVSTGSIRCSWYWQSGTAGVGGDEYFTLDTIEADVWYFTCLAWEYDADASNTVWRYTLRAENDSLFLEDGGTGNCPYNGGGNTLLGRGPAGRNQFFEGLIDELAICRMAFSYLMMRNRWNLGEGSHLLESSSTDVIGPVYHMDELSGSTVHDATIRNVNMTIRSPDRIRSWTAQGKVPLPTTPILEQSDAVDAKWGRTRWGRSRWVAAPPPVSVTIDTAAMTVNGGQVIALAATTTGTIRSVMWAGGGTFSDATVEDPMWTAPTSASEVSYTLTITVTGDEGQEEVASVVITVRASLALDAIADQTASVGTLFTLVLPTATGGAPPYTYIVSGLPDGVTFTPGA